MNFSKLIDICMCPNCGGDISAKATCGKCKSAFPVRDGRIYFDPAPGNVEENKKGAKYENWSNWRKANFDYYKRELDKLPKSASILDLGAGPVQFRNILEKFDGYVGLDFFPYEKVQIIRDLTKSMPFKDASFDVVLLSNTIEHIPNTAELLRECNRVLKKEGKIFATVPFLMKIHQAPYDFNRYTHYQLERLFKEAGFNSIEVLPLGHPMDVYIDTERHFFTFLLHSRFGDSALKKHLFYFVARILWQVKKIQNRFFAFVFKKCDVTPDFTQGYGVNAKN